MIQEVFASSFADPADRAAYLKAIQNGASEREAFAVGDNGIGCWGDLTAQDHTPMCALPPETMEEWFGSVAAAKHKNVLVIHGDDSVSCVLADRMPHRANITNGCGIDLNPAACRQLGLRPPIRVRVTIGPVLPAHAA